MPSIGLFLMILMILSKLHRSGKPELRWIFSEIEGKSPRAPSHFLGDYRLGILARALAWCIFTQ
jgi:hypothetical protein